MMSRAWGQQRQQAVLLRKRNALGRHGRPQHFHQRVEMRFGNVHVSVGRLHVTAFVLARATAELANLVGQAFLEGLGLASLKWLPMRGSFTARFTKSSTRRVMPGFRPAPGTGLRARWMKGRGCLRGGGQGQQAGCGHGPCAELGSHGGAPEGETGSVRTRPGPKGSNRFGAGPGSRPARCGPGPPTPA